MKLKLPSFGVFDSFAVNVIGNLLSFFERFGGQLIDRFTSLFR